MQTWRSQWRKQLCIAIVTCSIVFVLSNLISLAQDSFDSDLPSPKVHPLPYFLVEWQDKTKSGDYFNQIKSTPLGYLVWSKFPVTIFVEQPLNLSPDETAAQRRFVEWVATVRKAIAHWQVYFPLQEIADRETADIIILRSQPEREIKPNSQTGLFDIPRAVTAETSYRFYIKQNPSAIAHKMTVEISPNYTGISLLATTRHELGHALGIWGHSSNKNDAVYKSQVSDPPEISARDINTLKKIYQHPTRLGWEITK